MTLIKYIDRRFAPSALETIKVANGIIAEYQKQGFDLTLRQLYYQFVARGILANKLIEYKKLGSIINDARLAGLISWDAIVDRTRNLQGNNHWNSPQDIVAACVNQYKVDKWANQPNHVEVWIEKDALIGVIEKVCRELDVSYFSCRGYTSQSEMWSAGMRLKRHKSNGQQPHVIHLGDHDPSGKDMTRDIDDRLALFIGGAGCKVNRIALNMDQVEKYNPPPNPAKTTDKRAKRYIEEYGHDSWELDALDPPVIEKLIRKEVLKLRDEDLWGEMVEKEDRHKRVLQDSMDNMPDEDEDDE
jgi:hypothetical protein